MTNRKLLLISYALGRGPLAEFLGRDPEGIRVAFVPSAGTPYDDRGFVERERVLYREMGAIVQDVELEGADIIGLRQQLDGADLVNVSGGNTYYLLQVARASGFDQLIRERVDAGLPYVGSSAGAIVAGPDISPVEDLDDWSAAPDLTDLTGFTIVPFVPLPHYGHEKYEDKYQSIIRKYRDRYEILPIKDDEGVLVIGDTYQVRSTA